MNSRSNSNSHILLGCSLLLADCSLRTLLARDNKVNAAANAMRPFRVRGYGESRARKVKEGERGSGSIAQTEGEAKREEDAQRCNWTVTRFGRPPDKARQMTHAQAEQRLQMCRTRSISRH